MVVFNRAFGIPYKNSVEYTLLQNRIMTFHVKYLVHLLLKNEVSNMGCRQSKSTFLHHITVTLQPCIRCHSFDQYVDVQSCKSMMQEAKKLPERTKQCLRCHADQKWKEIKLFLRKKRLVILNSDEDTTTSAIKICEPRSHKVSDIHTYNTENPLFDSFNAGFGRTSPCLRPSTFNCLIATSVPQN